MNSTKLWQRRASLLTIILLTGLWMLLWGELSWGNLIAGALLAVFITYLLPMPRGPKRRLVVRLLALVHLLGCFIWDVIVASTQIALMIMSGRTPKEAIIRVQTHAQSDGFLAATAGFTALVPGSIVIDAHRLTGMLYIHVFDVPNGEAGLAEAHRRVLIQEERILRALASADELMDAGYRPGWSMRAGRLTEEEYAAHRARREAEAVSAK